MNRLRLGLASVALAGAIGAAIFFGSPALSQGTLSGPNATGCLLNQAAGPTVTQCIAANPTRRLLTICNVGTANTIWIAPAGITPAANGIGSYPLAAVASSVAACVNIPALGLSPGGNSNIGAAWSAIPAATPATLTIWEYQ